MRLNPKRKIKTKAGFSLVELMVGMSILAVLLSIGYASYGDYSRRQALAGVVRTLRGNIRLAQELAFAGKKDEKCTGLTLDGYKLKINTSSLVYSIHPVCGGEKAAIKTVNLAESGILSIVSQDDQGNNVNEITFKVLGQGNNIVNSLVTITLKQISTSRTEAIVVTKGGEIK